jgi:hypothetical protein
MSVIFRVPNYPAHRKPVAQRFDDNISAAQLLRRTYFYRDRLVPETGTMRSMT